MKKLILFFIANCIFLIACHKRNIPVITERTDSSVMRKVDTLYRAADTILGKSLFTSRCNRCHTAPETELYTSAKWDIIMERMAPRAKLKAQEAFDVLTYVKAHAKSSL